jgi:hypothetical protein
MGERQFEVGKPNHRKKPTAMKTMMKALMILLATVTLCSAQGYTRHRGHWRNGTYVSPHYQTLPDDRLDNNYSYPGNVNPWTGKRGHKYPDTMPRGFGDGLDLDLD